MNNKRILGRLEVSLSAPLWLAGQPFRDISTTNDAVRNARSLP